MPERIITLEEMGNHRSRRSIWFAVHNKVYDVTSFIGSHPGGVEIMLEHAGKHATKAYESVGHTADAREMLRDYEIGEVAEADRETTVAKRTDYSHLPEVAEESLLKGLAIPVGIAFSVSILISLLVS